MSAERGSCSPLPLRPPTHVGHTVWGRGVATASTPLHSPAMAPADPPSQRATGDDDAPPDDPPADAPPAPTVDARVAWLAARAAAALGLPADAAAALAGDADVGAACEEFAGGGAHKALIVWALGKEVVAVR